MARKRGNNEGSISRRRNGGWMAQYTVYTSDGRKRKTLYGKTRKEVADKLTKSLADLEGGLVYDAGSLTVGEYLQRWLPDTVRDTVRQRTYEGYVHVVERHIVPTIGRIKLKVLSPAHVRGLYREKLDAGLSNRTVRYIHTTLNKALKQAVADGLIPRNVAAGVKAPQPRGPEIRPLDGREVRALFEAVAGDRFEALYKLAVTAGLRKSELLGLKWEDADLDVGTLQVRRSLSETRQGPILEPPKSGKGRWIRLTTDATEALPRHRVRQFEESSRLDGLWEEHGLIFASQVGTLMSARNVNRAFKRHLANAGLPETTRFHDLRHTCATLLLKQGVNPKFVQELLGHADISLTLNVYSHVLPDMGDQTATAMEAALS
jgi:integrase